MEEAMRGGRRGFEYDAAAMVRLEEVGGEGVELVAVGEGQPLPLWHIVYWCLRCHDLAAAVVRRTRLQPPASLAAHGRGTAPSTSMSPLHTPLAHT